MATAGEIARGIVGQCQTPSAPCADIDPDPREWCQRCWDTWNVARALTTARAAGFQAGAEAQRAACLRELETMAETYFGIAGDHKAAQAWAKHDESMAFGRSCKVAATAIRATPTVTEAQNG